MATVIFVDDFIISVVDLSGEKLTFKLVIPLPENKQQEMAASLSFLFDEYFSADKTDMVYRVSNKMFGTGFFYHYWDSDRSEERERIGSKIRQIRENKNMEAKTLAKLANIDAANFSRIEQGKYAVGLDVLSRIAQALGVKVDLV